MLSKLLSYIILTISISCIAFSQDTTLLSYQDFLQLVKFNHPVSKRISLIKDRAAQSLRGARGNFDPRLEADANQKYYSSKEYFLLTNSTLSVPTWYGLDFYAGFETSQGTVLNDTDKLPVSGLGNVGIKIPLGQGLFYDKRRNAVEQAELINEFADIEIIGEQNNFILEANKSYWDWYSDYNKYLVFLNAEKNSRFRFEGIKSNFIVGESPAIDTVESFIQYQSILAGLRIAEQDLISSRNTLNTYLWGRDLLPLEVKQNTKPDSINDDIRKIDTTKFDSLIAVNPKVRTYEFKIRSAQLDRELYSELLKPKLNLKGNVLSAGFNLDNFAQFGTYYTNNYKLGLDFQFNLFLRQELSNLEIANIKIKESELDFGLKRLEIKNKVNAKYNKYIITLNNLALVKSMLENYRTMLKAEETRFQIGESSLFIVNSREQKLIEGEIKYYEQYAKTKQALAELLAELAILHLE
jgi:outer membrane protein TolC